MKRPLPAKAHTRLIVYGLLVILAASAGGYLWAQTHSAHQQIRSANLQIQDDQQEAKAFVKAAKLKREAEMAARKEKLRKQAAAEAAKRAAKNITSAPKATIATQCNSAATHNNPNALDIIVNKKHCLMPLDYAPSDLQVVGDATLRAVAAGPYQQMIAAAIKQGFSIRTTSSYRSYAQQVATYNYWVSVNGSIAAADTVSARPGYSEHQIGLTVDVAAGECSLECFGTTPAYTWMKQNAYEYGFVERYPHGKTAITGYHPEPWHYRYVGKAVAADMKQKRVNTLEEYWNIPGGSY